MKKSTIEVLTYEVTARSVKIFEGSKHIKTLPKIYEPVWDKVNLNFLKKSAQKEEKEEMNILLFPILKEKFETFLSETEKYVFELIDKAKFQGVRYCEGRDKSRFEMVYDSNGIERAVVCDKTLYNVSPEKLPTKYCNY